MVGRAAVVAVAMGAAACGSGGGGGADEKVVRQGATASVVGDRIWVAGGAEGTLADQMQGIGEPIEEVLVHDLDGAEVAAIDLGLGGDGLTDAAAVAAGDRTLVAGGRCMTTGFGCNGPSFAYAAWVADDAVEVVDLGDHDGAARVIGVSGGAVWLVVDTLEPKLVRVDPATGGAEVSALPPFAFTGGQCAGPDGVVAGVAQRDDDFDATGLELHRRGTAPGDEWVAAGIAAFDRRGPSSISLVCLGGGQVLATFAGEDAPAVLLGLDGARVLGPPPAELDGALLSALDPASGTAVVVPRPDGAPETAWSYRPGGEWVELGTVAGQLPALGIVDGEVVDGGGAATVAGAAAARIGRLP